MTQVWVLRINDAITVWSEKRLAEDAIVRYVQETTGESNDDDVPAFLIDAFFGDNPDEYWEIREMTIDGGW